MRAMTSTNSTWYRPGNSRLNASLSDWAALRCPPPVSDMRTITRRFPADSLSTEGG